jgi:predicted acylesterase/phospholipase RssA
MSKQQVALVLSGGSSLGSYIAGALDELMHAFAVAKDRYEIDIITGASAGATTAAIIGYGLLYQGGGSDLYNIWVKKIDITHLLSPGLPPGEHLSLLNPQRLREVAKEVIRPDQPQNLIGRAPFCSPDLVLAVTLANSTALPYISQVKQKAAGREEEFVQFRHTEQETFYLDDHLMPEDLLWERISHATQASAAIPFIFPLAALKRGADNALQYIQQTNFDGERNFWYYDGGTFNNLPVDLAWHFHKSRYGNTLDNRVVVVINPWRQDFKPLSEDPPYPSMFNQAWGLLGAMRGESSVNQFEGDIVRFSQLAQKVDDGEDGSSKLIPGIDLAPVDLLRNFALVMPRANDPPLRGVHLLALSAFLDERFREYDFRRGAADARRIATERLRIDYEVEREPGFYEPDNDPRFQIDISTYEKLALLPSTLYPGRTVQEVFEAALQERIQFLLKQWRLPIIHLIQRPLAYFVGKRLMSLVRDFLPGAWQKTG